MALPGAARSPIPLAIITRALGSLAAWFAILKCHRRAMALILKRARRRASNNFVLTRLRPFCRRREDRDQWDPIGIFYRDLFGCPMTEKSDHADAFICRLVKAWQLKTLPVAIALRCKLAFCLFHGELTCRGPH